jgi:DNA-binding Lrp family transcriptional regulator
MICARRTGGKGGGAGCDPFRPRATFACPAYRRQRVSAERRLVMVAAVVLIRADRDAIPSAAREVAGIEGVAEVYSVSGDWDLIAVIRVAEWERIAEVVTEKLARVPGLQRTNTLVAFRVYSRQDLAKAYDMFE